ncbi:hypothetical protein OKW41_005487 [Paraburkholderia sp. UCT70]|uniref:hypothetical protein n=1 Tax=Paraburkholderia sp. UCT70 TaxID=2991068 RepID=UPI003D20BC7E
MDSPIGYECRLARKTPYITAGRVTKLVDIRHQQPSCAVHSKKTSKAHADFDAQIRQSPALTGLDIGTARPRKSRRRQVKLKAETYSE